LRLAGGSSQKAHHNLGSNREHKKTLAVCTRKRPIHISSAWHKCFR
jgi:hypothetical protein